MHDDATATTELPLIALPDRIFFPGVEEIVALPGEIASRVEPHDPTVVLAWEVLGDEVAAETLPTPGPSGGRLASHACIGTLLSVRTNRSTWPGRVRCTRRVRLLDARPFADRSVFQATVQLLDDVVRAADMQVVPDLRAGLIESVEAIASKIAGADDLLKDLARAEVSLGTLCDILAFTLPLSATDKFALLAEVRVVERAAFLKRKLEAAAGDPRFHGELRGRFPA
ncbi:MAG: hypothetical protein D6741_05390, partial [Planctomycetota bacterium]